MLYTKIVILLVAFTADIQLFTMEQDYSLHQYISAPVSNYSIKNPFTKEEKKELIAHLLSGDPLLDKGMFQLCAAITSGQRVDNQKYCHYFLYKTYTYVQKILFSEMPTCFFYQTNEDLIPVKGLVRTALYKLCKKLEELDLSEKRNIFAPNDMFNYAFLCAFLKDIAEYKISRYCLVLSNQLYEWVYKEFNKAHTSLDPEKLALDIFSLLKEKDGELLSINDIKSWHGKDSRYCIVPFISGNGLIGINTLMLAIAQGYCPVGICVKTSHFHNCSYKTSSDLTFHDLLHFFLLINGCKENDNPVEQSSRIKIFYQKVIDTITHFIKEYKKDENDTATRDHILKQIFALFGYMHETPAAAFLMEKSYFAKKARISILGALSELLLYEELYEEEDQLSAQKASKSLQSILFNGLDMLALYKKVYPRLSLLLIENGLTVEDGVLKNLKSSSQSATLKQFMPVLYYLAWCMADAWNLLVEERGDYFDDTLVYLKASPEEQEALLKQSNRKY